MFSFLKVRIKRKKNIKRTIIRVVIFILLIIPGLFIYGFGVALVENIKTNQAIEAFKGRANGIYTEESLDFGGTIQIRRYYEVSRETSYDTWWTRKIIKASIRYNNTIIDLVNVHLGWTGYDEIFENQVDLLIDNLDFDNTNLIAGDFNVSENSDGYKYVLSKGLNDLYFNNNMDYFHDVTHRDYIDEKKIATRIDYVMSNEEFDTKDRKIVFKDKRVSDHFGVYIEIEFKEVDE